MQIIESLKSDHDKVKKILQDLEETTDRAAKTREELFSRLKEEIALHEAIEEELLYPFMRELPESREAALEAYEEHRSVDLLIEELDDYDRTDSTWGEKLTVLRENIEHHIEEEEGTLFPLVLQLVDYSEYEEMSIQAEELRRDFEEKRSESTPEVPRKKAA